LAAPHVLHYHGFALPGSGAPVPLAEEDEYDFGFCTGTGGDATSPSASRHHFQKRTQAHAAALSVG
jgi:hypothetical protein